ncbi:MAG: type restriction enzyme [Thermoleophilales bacterium]|jgi:hypothetical protein|nr:type restriction enzyme [Thermoleophilales bacterium]
MHPDFVFFHEVDGEVVASIVDPHGHPLPDASTSSRRSPLSQQRTARSFAASTPSLRLTVGCAYMLASDVRDAVLASKDSLADLCKSADGIPYDSGVP